MRREGIDMDDAPPDVQDAALRLHQAALAAWYITSDRWAKSRLNIDSSS